MKFQQGVKYLWQLPHAEHQTLFELASSYNVSVPIMQTVFARGHVDKKSIDSFLFSSYEKDVASPHLMKDAEKSVDRILYAIENKEKILIFGDYDVDGITSSALMMHCLLPLGADVNFFLPHRVHDGYGLSEKIVRRAKENNYNLIITVDNGITAFEPAALAKQLGIDLIITDHHQPHGELPDAFAIINPHQKECPYPYKKFAGVGVSFKVLSLLYARKGLEMPSKAYELLLLGTVADVVPLTGENRFWVRHGLNHIHAHETFSFNVLKRNGNVVRPRLSATDIGFSITPQINALGRLEDPRQGVKFLIGSDTNEVERVGKVLLELNQARKEIERSIYKQVVSEIESNAIDLSREKIILAASNNWPAGVIGLVASRLVGAYGRPAILLHMTKDGIAKGSCRSIPALNMFEVLQSASHLLIQFGGHAMAAGLSLRIDNIPAFKEHVENYIAQHVTDFDLKLKIHLDAEVKMGDLTKKFIEDMEFLEPFGNENPEPLFYLSNVSLMQKPTLLKDAHIKCQIFADGVIKPIIFFNRPELFEQLQSLQSSSFDIAAHVKENYWNGKISIELTGVDIAQRQEQI